MAVGHWANWPVGLKNKHSTMVRQAVGAVLKMYLKWAMTTSDKWNQNLSGSGGKMISVHLTDQPESKFNCLFDF